MYQLYMAQRASSHISSVDKVINWQDNNKVRLGNIEKYKIKTQIPEIEVSLDDLLTEIYTKKKINSSRQFPVHFHSNKQRISENCKTIHVNLQQTISNQFLVKYINHVQDKYSLENPYNKYEKRKNLKQKQLNGTKDILKTPQKQYNYETANNTSTVKQSKTKKLIQLKDRYRKQTEQLTLQNQSFSNSILRASADGQPFKKYSVGSGGNKQIGYRTKQKINFKKINAQFISPDITKDRISYGDDDKITIARKRFSTSNQSNYPVSQIFSYCQMCEQKILQENLLYHEKRCTEFQNKKQISHNDLIETIKNKINRMKDEIQNEWINQNSEQYIKQMNEIKNQIKAWLTENFSSQQFISQNLFQQLQLKFNKNVIFIYEKINKMNWFKHLYWKLKNQARPQGQK